MDTYGMSLAPGLTAIIGGARSGKSHFGQNLAKEWEQSSHGRVIYIATSEIWEQDTEMLDRIQRHQADRPGHWQTLEDPQDLALTIQKESTDNTLLLIDCATLWLTKQISGRHAPTEILMDPLRLHGQQWIQKAQEAPGPVLVISNDVGQGITPLDALSRKFQDLQGWLNQDLAKAAKHCWQMSYGIPRLIAQNGIPV
jgi:adenosylcobinamide kinase/adenosylcobinamide-phosphate guanylyltransferase